MHRLQLPDGPSCKKKSSEEFKGHIHLKCLDLAAARFYPITVNLKDILENKNNELDSIENTLRDGDKQMRADEAW